MVFDCTAPEHGSSEIVYCTEIWEIYRKTLETLQLKQYKEIGGLEVLKSPKGPSYCSLNF